MGQFAGGYQPPGRRAPNGDAGGRARGQARHRAVTGRPGNTGRRRGTRLADPGGMDPPPHRSARRQPIAWALLLALGGGCTDLTARCADEGRWCAGDVLYICELLGNRLGDTYQIRAVDCGERGCEPSPYMGFACGAEDEPTPGDRPDVGPIVDAFEPPADIDASTAPLPPCEPPPSERSCEPGGLCLPSIDEDEPGTLCFPLPGGRGEPCVPLESIVARGDQCPAWPTCQGTCGDGLRCAGRPGAHWRCYPQPGG